MDNKNLWQRYFGVGLKAQIATLLTLIIAVIFLFLAITINIGKVSQKKTVLSNAADAAALNYASQMGSFAHYLSCTYVKCKRKFCKFSWSLFFKAMMWAGIMGIVVGLALGALAGVFAAGLGGIAGGVVGFITQGPMHYMEASAWKGMSRQFKKMSNQMKFREGVFLFAMMRVVDDPNLEDDVHDLDEDGLTDDKIPQFLRVYDTRLRTLRQRYTTPLMAAIEDFKSEMQTFDEQAQVFRTYLNDTFIPLLGNLEDCGYALTFWELGEADEGLPCIDVCSEAACQDYEEGCDAPPEEECVPCSSCYEDYLDSLLIDEVDIIIWDIDDFRSFAYGGFDAITGEEYKGIYRQNTGELLQGISDWLPLLFDSSLDPCTGLTNVDDYYDVLGKWDTFITGWISELEVIEGNITGCIDDPESECSEDGDGELETACCCALEDVVSPAIAELETFQERLRDFQVEISSLYTTENELALAYERMGKVYSWSDKFDREGAPLINHYVEVKLINPPPPMPRIKAYTKDHKKCVELVNHGGAVWVEISRYDESHAGGPSLWEFRYHIKGDEAEWSRCDSYNKDDNPDDYIFDHPECQKYLIKARSQAAYSYTQDALGVGIPPRITRVK